MCLPAWQLTRPYWKHRGLQTYHSTSCPSGLVAAAAPKPSVLSPSVALSHVNPGDNSLWSAPSFPDCSPFSFPGTSAKSTTKTPVSFFRKGGSLFSLLSMSSDKDLHSTFYRMDTDKITFDTSTTISQRLAGTLKQTEQPTNQHQTNKNFFLRPPSGRREQV